MYLRIRSGIQQLQEAAAKMMNQLTNLAKEQIDVKKKETKQRKNDEAVVQKKEKKMKSMKKGKESRKNN